MMRFIVVTAATAALVYYNRKALAYRANQAAEYLWERVEMSRDRRRQARRRREALRQRSVG